MFYSRIGFTLGAAYGKAETSLREFVEHSCLPFLPTPMGKGVVPDTHELCVAAARSRSAQANGEKQIQLCQKYRKFYCSHINIVLP